MDKPKLHKPVTLIIGYAMTDVYLVNQLLFAFPDLKIVRYRQYKTKNLTYYITKLFARGFCTALGIKMVSVYLRGEIFLEKLLGKSIWKRFGVEKPALSENITLQDCSTIEQLCEITKHDTSTVVITQSLRLDSAFFTTNKNILQIVGGRFPEYIGDTSVFWAKAAQRQADYCFTIIKRRKYFNSSIPLTFCVVDVSEYDTIRSLRIKGIMASAKSLIEILNGDLPKPVPAVLPKSQVYSTPTIFDYLKVTFLHKRINIPHYATKKL